MSTYFIPCSFTNTDPCIGAPMSNGTQQISLYTDGVRRTYNSTPEKIDEFMKYRKEQSDKTGAPMLASFFGLAAVGTAIGAAISALCTKKLPLGETAFLGGAFGALAGLLFGTSFPIKAEANINKAAKKIIINNENN